MLLEKLGHQVPAVRQMMPRALRQTIYRFFHLRHMRQQPDRLFFEATVPELMAAEGCRTVLFVGSRAYTAHYVELFAKQGIELWTCDIDPDAAEFGAAGRHRTLDICAVRSTDFPVAFDGIVFSGVIGFGVDRWDQVQSSLVAVAGLVQPGRPVVIGWNTDKGVDPLILDVSQDLFQRSVREPFRERISFPGVTHVYDVMVRTVG